MKKLLAWVVSAGLLLLGSSAPSRSRTAVAVTPVEITPSTEIPATIPHIVPLITPEFTTVVPAVLPLCLPIVALLSYVIGLSVPVLLEHPVG